LLRLPPFLHETARRPLEGVILRSVAPQTDKEEKVMPLKGSRSRTFGLFMVASALLIYACNTSVERSPAVQQALSQTPAVAPVVSINALMVALVDHASHELWNIEKEGGTPKDDKG
jgi:hypothetical protein